MGRAPMNSVPAKAMPQALAAPYMRILEALCAAGDFQTVGKQVLAEISRVTGCEAVGLRVHDGRDDYPYFTYLGFDDSFIAIENSLCLRKPESKLVRDTSGRAALACVCGAVIRGEVDPKLPFFTAAGSFWTNSTKDLVASGALDLSNVRGTCVARGYESVALVPLRGGGGGIVGLLQANSRQRGRFGPEVLDFLERVGRLAGHAIEEFWRREQLARMTREFEDRQRRAEALVAVGEMASTLAHEVKNPLAGMMLSATRLRKLLRGDEQREPIAEHLCASVNALNDTVGRITKMVAGGPRLERGLVQVGEVLESAIYLVAPRAEAHGVHVVRDMAEGLPPVSADAGLLRQAFLNLLVNALEAMPSSGTLRVRTGVAAGGRVEAVVADTGPGIGAEVAGQLFKPFVTTKPNGTGLGLAIVRRIVELHAGTVALRPAAGGGTEAVVSLPAAPEGGSPAAPGKQGSP
jgi:signal transduction histidine kinase